MPGEIEKEARRAGEQTLRFENQSLRDEAKNSELEKLLTKHLTALESRLNERMDMKSANLHRRIDETRALAWKVVLGLLAAASGGVGVDKLLLP